MFLACLWIATGAAAKVPDFANMDGALAPSGSAVTFAAKAAVPLGFYQLCKAGNSVCRQSAGTKPRDENGSVRLSGALLNEMAAINRSVNRSIRPISDAAHYGVVDRWSVSPKSGDCEDFALTKKARLLRAGWPSSALLLALAKTSAGEEHAVLIVRTDRGDFVLDNLRSDIRRWSAGLYRWSAIQSPTDVWSWKQFGHGTTRVATNQSYQPQLPQPLDTDVAPKRSVDTVVSSASFNKLAASKSAALPIAPAAPATTNVSELIQLTADAAVTARTATAWHELAQWFIVIPVPAAGSGAPANG
jgi:predicted transglutaminase-like cysteine proteinase